MESVDTGEEPVAGAPEEIDFDIGEEKEEEAIVNIPVVEEAVEEGLENLSPRR